MVGRVTTAEHREPPHVTHSAEPWPDTSLLAGLDNNPAFIETALSRGTFAECGSCHRVLAVAVNLELAEMTALANGTGHRIGREIRCQEHDHITKARAGAH